MNAWNRLVMALSATEDARVLASFRIAVASVLFVTLVGIWRADLLDMLYLGPELGGVRSVSTPFLFRWIGSQGPEVVHTVFWVATVGSALMACGLGGRLTALVTLQSFMGLVDLNSHAGGSYDELLTNAMWLCVLGDTTATWSLDGWLKTGRWQTGAQISVWPRLLVVYQLMLMYWTTGLQKLSSYWVPGGDYSALYYIFQQPTWQRGDMSWVAWQPWFFLTQLGTAGSWVWVVTVPLWAAAFLLSLRNLPHPSWVRATRWTYAGVGAFFHLAVFSFMNVGPFSWASMAYYPCLVHGREWWGGEE